MEGGWGGEDNLDIDPFFQDMGDYHLSDDSSLIDAGHDEDVPVDLDGLPRLVGGAPDMGAYEKQSLLRLSARSGDGRVYLAWRVLGDNPALASFAISSTIAPHGGTAYLPLWVLFGIWSGEVKLAEVDGA